jgi:hypothetical protein
MQTTKALLWILSLAALHAAGCGGAATGTITGDAGTTGPGSDASSAGMDGSAPPPGDDGAAGPSALCAKLASYEEVCPPTDRCAAAELQYCSTWAPSMSAGYDNAVENCLNPPYTCPDGGGGGNPVEGACLLSYLSTPTAAQQKVKADFCASCPDGAAPSAPQACTNFFALILEADGITAAGAAVLLVNDALAGTMDQQCTGVAAEDAGAQDCAQAFALCSVEVVLQDANLPGACTDVSLLATAHLHP